VTPLTAELELVGLEIESRQFIERLFKGTEKIECVVKIAYV
jgi:hypothetical protein